MDQRHPDPRTHVVAERGAGVEARHVQRALFEQPAVGGAGRVGAVEGSGGDELVHVLVALVAAHVDDDPAVRGHHELGVLVLEAAQRGALDRLAARAERVDLDHPAEAIRLVRVGGDVEARVDGVPAVAEAVAQAAAGIGADAITALQRREHAAGRIGVAEVAVEILLAGEEGAPRRPAGAAVVEHAQHLAAGGVGRGLHQVVAGARALQRHRRVAVDAPVVRRRLHVLPAAVGRAPHVRHRGTVTGLALACLLVGEGQQPIGSIGARSEEILGIDVLVVDDQQAFVAAVAVAVGSGIEAEEPHAVVVVADLLFLLGGAVAGIGLPGRGKAVDRLTPGQEGRRHIARRHHHGVAAGGGHGGKAQRLLGRRDGCHRRSRFVVVTAAAGGQATQEGQRRGAQAGQQQPAPAGTCCDRPLDDVGQREVARRIGNTVVVKNALSHARNSSFGEAASIPSHDDTVVSGP